MSGRPPRTSGEDELLGWLRGLLPTEARRLQGDDAAPLDPAGRLALTVDSQIAGTHFPPDLQPEAVARRLLAVNLSDLAAVGARPGWALLALNAPAGYPHARFLAAMVEACREHGILLAGGDLARTRDQLVATLVAVGTTPPGGRWVGRESGRPGDRLWVSGTLGESALGRRLLAAGAKWDPAEEIELPGRWGELLATAARAAVERHLLPRPHLAEGEWLGRQERAAAIDVSDGLLRDLARLATASGCGAEIDPGALPMAPGHAELAERLGADPTAEALGGGEDYVLLAALPADVTPPEPPWSPIGRLVAEPGLWLLRDGRRQPAAAAGWDHLELGS